MDSKHLPTEEQYRKLAGAIKLGKVLQAKAAERLQIAAHVRALVRIHLVKKKTLRPGISYGGYWLKAAKRAAQPLLRK